MKNMYRLFRVLNIGPSECYFPGVKNNFALPDNYVILESS